MCEILRGRMPESACDCGFSGGGSTTSSNGSVSSSGFWSKHRDDVSFNQLQKFWSDLSPQARQELLRIDKQTLFEQARKNMYCSRCNGLLLEGFLQIVMYGKSLQHEGAVGQILCNKRVASKNETVDDPCLTGECNDDIQDPSVHPWGGLTTTRDGTLTLLDCYLYSKSLKGLQNVFGCARARERERELLYPDACGGGGRGWISQGMVGYGRGHGTRETCALHTARLSVDTLVDFWSALGEETRHSLLKMKEEDFMERLMYRFDSKRFCRDCRKNVIREFKELKELKRMRREARCTSWFCVADTSFQYEVTLDTIQVDWHQNYTDSTGTYHHYEWAVGTGEGKSDILEFENVGLNSRVRVSGLDLTGLTACYITLRAWRMDGRCNELSVKAHALKGQRCVHCRLVVGEGFVTITRGDSIRRFFEHAEEAEEEEDDDSMDKDGNEVDGECTRPQKHAKSPELAREFLLDAATVIFKEQVEKAFREGTARQNAHSIFVSLALKLLEDRVLVACKDIITLENQCKLLEEEEKEKREEEERKERRRAKEKEKKLRRKERLRSKEKKNPQPDQTHLDSDTRDEEPTIKTSSETTDPLPRESLEDDHVLSAPTSEDYNHEEQNENSVTESGYMTYASDRSKNPRRKPKWSDPSPKWSDRRRFAAVFDGGGTVSKPEPSRFHGDGFEPASRNIVNKPRGHVRSTGSRYCERLHCSHNRVNDRFDPHGCSCYPHHDYRAKVGKPEPETDVSKPYYKGKYNGQTEYARERPKTKTANALKKAWEPMETQKRYTPRSGSESNVQAAAMLAVEQDGPAEPIGSSDGSDSVEPNRLKSGSSVHNSDSTLFLSGTTDLSNSNSDSCSSFSSNTPNPESDSTSDSEDTSQHSEGQDYEKVKKIDVTDSHPQAAAIPPPPLQSHGIQFPVFQAPSMGYFNQAAVPWIPTPPNGLMPLPLPLPHPNPNHYLFASPCGYGLNGSSVFVPFGQPLTPPLVNHGQPPVYHPVPPVTASNLPEPPKAERNGKHPPPPASDGDSDKTRKGNSGFSLFHFGGPVALTDGFESDAVAVEIEAGKKDEGVEEYNLFATSNGIRFSIF